MFKRPITPAYGTNLNLLGVPGPPISQEIDKAAFVNILEEVGAHWIGEMITVQNISLFEMELNNKVAGILTGMYNLNIKPGDLKFTVTHGPDRSNLEISATVAATSGFRVVDPYGEFWDKLTTKLGS